MGLTGRGPVSGGTGSMAWIRSASRRSTTAGSGMSSRVSPESTGVVLRWDVPCPLVALLDEEPLLAVPGFALARPLHPNQRPAAAQLVAAQLEQELAPLEALVEGFQLHVRAPVPDDDVSGPVVAVGYAPLEVRVVEGMVLDEGGETLVGGIGGGTLRHGPGTEHPVDLEPHVPVEVARLVLLHHEGARAGVGGRDAGRKRLRRRAGLALGAVGGEVVGLSCRHWSGRPAQPRRGCAGDGETRGPAPAGAAGNDVSPAWSALDAGDEVV